MTYNIAWSDPNLKDPSSITLQPLSTDSGSTSLVLYGKGAPNYGQGQQQNFLRLLENFCSDVEPDHPTIGQLWYDRGNNQLKIRQWDGTIALWRIIGCTVSPTAPVSASFGDLWYDTTANLLKYFTVTGWLGIVDANVMATHISDEFLHLTSDQNILLDAIQGIITSDEVLALNGVTSNIQVQLDAISNANTSGTAALQAETNARQLADINFQTLLNNEIATRQSSDNNLTAAYIAADTLKVSKAGDNMSGFLTLINNNPTNTWHAVPKQYLDQAIFNAFAAMSGGGVIYQREFETAASASVNTNFNLPVAPSVFGTYNIGSNDLFVFVGGVKQIVSSNYTEFTNTQVNFSTAISTGTTVTFEKFILGGGLNAPSTAAITSIVRSSVVAAANQTAFALPGGFSNVAGSNTLLVWANGIKQIANVGATPYSFTESSANTITFNTPLPAGTIVEMVGFNLASPATIQRNVFTATTAGQTSFLLNPSINALVDGTWTFVSGIHQGKTEAVTTPNGYSVILANGVQLGTLVEVFSFKIA